MAAEDKVVWWRCHSTISLLIDAQCLLVGLTSVANLASKAYLTLAILTGRGGCFSAWIGNDSRV